MRRGISEVPSLRRAENLFRLWHQKHPNEDDHQRMTTSFAPVVGYVGHAQSIVYLSDKWEDDGDFHPYEHDFDSHPMAFSRDGEGREKDTAHLLGVPSVNGAWAMPLLAYVQSVTLDDGRGPFTVKFPDFPVMTCSPDRKTLVILHRPAHVFIRGGTMTITERGIVD